MINPDEQDRHGAATDAVRRVGIAASFDFNRQEELRRWVPDDVACPVELTPAVPFDDNIGLVTRLSHPAILDAPVDRLLADGAEAVAYLCAACSFARGARGEQELRTAMRERGVPAALTTSGAVTLALRTLRAARVAVVHPYQKPVDALLQNYLHAAGFTVTSLTSLGLGSVEEAYDVTTEQVREAVWAGDHPEADAVFVSCSALPTYDALPTLEAALGKPVISANQVTMWALLQSVGCSTRAPGRGHLETLTAARSDLDGLT
ncbi:Asp/Glu racemase [Streptomyces sp. SID14478]|uniref:maleate cis-trans isomerase family protein n=1 Tax=Streptomyces sp. SID14478 TaxID=2706073 RepID=UPI0013E02DAA|nr:Asp/Glu racemase [Streptomyces sp. SID14478]NEB80127.1 Asp/Glu racemase [Streptomyces sp. SID14478]